MIGIRGGGGAECCSSFLSLWLSQIEKSISYLEVPQSSTPYPFYISSSCSCWMKTPIGAGYGIISMLTVFSNISWYWMTEQRCCPNEWRLWESRWEALKVSKVGMRVWTFWIQSPENLPCLVLNGVVLSQTEQTSLLGSSRIPVPSQRADGSCGEEGLCTDSYCV